MDSKLKCLCYFIILICLFYSFTLNILVKMVTLKKKNKPEPLPLIFCTFQFTSHCFHSPVKWHCFSIKVCPIQKIHFNENCFNNGCVISIQNLILMINGLILLLNILANLKVLKYFVASNVIAIQHACVSYHIMEVFVIHQKTVVNPGSVSRLLADFCLSQVNYVSAKNVPNSYLLRYTCLFGL